MLIVSILGCGWLGSKLAGHLQNKGFSVKGSATSAASLSKLNQLNIEAFEIKITETLATSVYIESFFNTDVLIVSLKPNRSTNDGGFYEKQIKVIAQLAKKHQIKKIIFWGSTSVYGDNNAIANESTDSTPGRPSGFSLRKAEKELLNENAFPSIILRLGGLIGYDRNPYETIKLNKKAGSLFVPVNLVHADDVISITEKVINNVHENTILNVVADKHPLRIDYYKKAYNDLNIAPEAFHAESDRNFKIVSNAKLKHDLEYQFLYADPRDIYNDTPNLN